MTITDEELAALLKGVDPDEPIDLDTWGLIERALFELQSRRVRESASAIEQSVADIEGLREVLRRAIPILERAEDKFEAYTLGDVIDEFRAALPEGK